MNKKVCILTSVHSAKDIRIYVKEAVSLRKAGYDVVILNKELDGTDEYGIVFKRVSIPQGRIDRFLKASKIMYRAAVREKADIYHFHDPELLSCGKKLLKQGAVVYDSHEDVPRQILSKFWIPSLFRRPLSRLFDSREKRISRKLSAIITATPRIAKAFTDSGCKRVYTINNYPVLSECSAENRDWSTKENCVCYIGALSGIRGIKEMVTAIEKCDCRLVIAGTFDDHDFEEATVRLDGWKKVDFLGQVSRSKVFEVMGKAKAGLVMLHPLPNHMEALPNKMFEYMAAGIPVISSNFPYWKSIILDGDCGVTADPLDPDSIANAVRTVLSDADHAKIMGENGKKLVREKYNWSVEEKKLLSVYRRLP